MEIDKIVYAPVSDIKSLTFALSEDGFFVEIKPNPDIAYGYIFDRKLKIPFNVGKLEIKSGIYELHCFVSEGSKRLKEFADSYKPK